MFETSRALALFLMNFMGFEFIIVEKAQQARLQIHLLWIEIQRAALTDGWMQLPFLSRKRTDMLRPLRQV
jgi:hypothetical protein